MVKFVDRVKMNLTTTGTGTVTFGSVVSGFQSLSDASVVDSDVVRYTIESGTNYESGTGTIGLTGSTYTMARSPSSSSESDNSAINLGSGAVCFLTMLAEDVVQNLADLDNVSSTVPAGGQTLSWDSGTSSWSPASPSGGITSVGNYAGLPASPNETDLAWVQDTKSLYIYDGTEWDRFYTDTNATPDWTTEPPETEALAQDGTATVQTVVASDPEGFPIEYSYDTNPSNQAQATISQSNNAFTITPSTNTSNEGSFTLRYRASDGIHSTSRSTVYSLIFYTNPDIANLSDDNDTFSFTAQDPDTQSVVFKPDGTKMYAAGYSNSVYQYSLSTAWQVSTATYDNVSFSHYADTTESFCRCAIFNPDGTKMYITGSGTDRVWEFSLSTAWDISTASYNSNFDLNPPDSVVTTVAFNNDGTKMFMLGASTDKVYEYPLTTGFDVSTASSSTANFSVSSQESTPLGMVFNNDGTKMYICGTTDKVFEYDLSTGFDISTASYNGVFKSINADPSCLAIKSDGSKVYAINYSNDDVYTYSS